MSDDVKLVYEGEQITGISPEVIEVIRKVLKNIPGTRQKYDGVSIKAYGVVGELKTHKLHIIFMPGKRGSISDKNAEKSFQEVFETVWTPIDELHSTVMKPVVDKINFKDIIKGDYKDKLSCIRNEISEINQGIESMGVKSKLMPSYLFFELFIYEELKKQFEEANISYHENIVLFPETKNANKPLRNKQYVCPDFLIRHNEKLIVLDVKDKLFKNRNGEYYQDQYQVCTYISRLSADYGIIIYSRFDNTQRNVERISEIESGCKPFHLCHCFIIVLDKTTWHEFYKFLKMLTDY